MTTETRTVRRSSITLLEGVFLLGATAALVWMIAWGGDRTRKQAQRSHARKLLAEQGFILILNQKDHVAQSETRLGSTFEQPLIRSDDSPIHRGLLEDLALFDEVQSLTLRNSYLEDSDLKTLTPLKQLRELDISGSLITDEGLSVLTAFPELEELDISLTKVRGPGLRHLRPLKKLRRLRVTNNEIPDSAMRYVEMLTQLESIDVAETWLSDRSKEKLNPIRVRQSRGRHRLFEMGIHCTPEEFRAGAAKSMIGVLNVSWPRRVQVVIPPDGQITRLALNGSDLRLQRFPSAHRAAYRLMFPTLQYLNLSHTRFDAQRSPAFGVMDDLRELNLVASDCRDHAFRRLRGCNRLKTLDARLCGLTDVSLSVIGSLTNLETLRLGQNYITDSQLKNLTGLKNLRHLELDSCDITDAGLETLSEIPNLKRLSVSRSYISREGVARLKTARPNLTIQRFAVPAVAATDELVGQFNRTREAGILSRLKAKGFEVFIEGSYGRAIQITFPNSYEATDEDMRWIGRLTGLRKIQGDRTSRITVKGVRELTGLEDLMYLYLKSSQLDDSTLDEILHIRNLDRTALYSTSITQDSVKAFQKRHPVHDASWNSEYVRIYLNYHK